MRRPRKAMNQINVVPYIDVMLVLLVIFMVTAPLVTPGQVELPSISSAPTAPVEPMEVTVRKDGSLQLRDLQLKGPQQSYSPEEIVARIRAKKETRPDQPVVIVADRTTSYENVLKVLDQLNREHISHVGLLVRPADR